MSRSAKRDHGGNLDAAISQYGGKRSDWLDLSTGINPTPYPVPNIPSDAWTALPDQAAQDRLIAAARQFWDLPSAVGVLPVPGASAAIAQIPRLLPAGRVSIPAPTYNEHAASFSALGWTILTQKETADACVHVHPNNPDGRVWQEPDLGPGLRIIDESFCDVMPAQSLAHLAQVQNTLILKSFGKFWGLAGLRLGFVLGDPKQLTRLQEMLGPWAASGPALHIGAAALSDQDWAAETRKRLQKDADRLDQLVQARGASLLGGTSLFRLYEVEDATAWQTHLAQHHIWSRVFPYNDRWLRLGLPPASGWSQLTQALQ